ncbi:MAG: radical SAM protein [Thermoleophilaceae bacterium]|nr:radical SAM protein [Thermoleophilaceae bacterium]
MRLCSEPDRAAAVDAGGREGHRRLTPAPGLRVFSWRGRTQAHVSAVPLPYLSLGDGLTEALRSFDGGRAVDAVADDAGLPPGAPRAAFARFAVALEQAGILLDSERPDPIHGLRPDERRGASLYLFPTNRCNLGCVYCYASSGPAAGPRLSDDDAALAIDRFFEGLDREVEQVSLVFHGGGEPTVALAVMRSAWRRFQAHAERKGLRARGSTITNGVFGSEARAFLSEPGIDVMFSFDGPRQAAQRPTAGGRDSRARVVENMRALAAAGKPTRARATLTREGVASFRALVEDAAELKIADVQVEPASIVGRGATTVDGPPEPLAFAEAYLDAFRLGLRLGVRVTTAAFNIIRVGDGSYCGAVRSLRGVTPDGYVSSCVEATRGEDAARNPFMVGRIDRIGRRLELWDDKVESLRGRTGDSLPHCRTCYMVDTCAGGCLSRALAQTGTIHARDEHNCIVTRRINPELAADIAEGRLLPEAGWLPFSASLTEAETRRRGMEGRVVALVPTFARRAWLANPDRRPFLPAPPGAPTWFRPAA